MTTPPATRVHVLAFADLDAFTAYAVWKLRQDVFVIEQDCPYDDLDGRDLEPGTRHVLLLSDEPDTPHRLLGYVRILDDADRETDADGRSVGPARIGRVVLGADARGQGLADVMMRAAVAEIGDRACVLDAQAPLAGWYATHGFEVSGPEFLEDDIAHLPMRRPAASIESIESTESTESAQSAEPAEPATE